MAEWIPLYQTLIETGLPILLGLIIILLFWKQVRQVLDALVIRIQAGAPVKFGSLDIGAVPEAMRNGDAKSATAEGARGVMTPENVKSEMMQKHYPLEISEDIYLVHASREVRPYTGPRTGSWQVRISVEAYEDETLLDEITRVTYRLHDSFNPNVMTTEARDKAFELWVSIYGEFNLVAYVERKNKPPLWLTRYLDLPGRPTN